MTIRLLDAAAGAAALTTLVLVALPGTTPVVPWVKMLPALFWAVSLAVQKAPAWPVMAAALVLAAAGDWLLADGRWFLAGAGAFAGMQVLYSVRFWGLALGRPKPRRGLVLVPAGYAAVTALVLALLWPLLGPLAPAMAVYASLLTVAASGASVAGRGRWLALGGALFFASDAMILVVRAFAMAPPLGEWVVLVPYWLGQFLIVRDQRRVSGV